MIPSYRTGTVPLRRCLVPIANSKLTTVARHTHTDDVMLQPFFIHGIEHLVMEAGWQVNRITIFYGIALILKQHFSLSAENVVNLFQTLMFVIIGSLTSLERVSGKATQPVQTVTVIVTPFL